MCVSLQSIFAPIFKLTRSISSAPFQLRFPDSYLKQDQIMDNRCSQQALNCTFKSLTKSNYSSVSFLLCQPSLYLPDNRLQQQQQQHCNSVSTCGRHSPLFNQQHLTRPANHGLELTHTQTHLQQQIESKSTKPDTTLDRRH